MMTAYFCRSGKGGHIHYIARLGATSGRLIRLLMLASAAWWPAGIAHAAPPACGDAAPASLAGNRSCATAAERKVINKMINGPWLVGECDVRHPNGWRTRRAAKDARVLIIPNPSSFLTPLNFQVSVQVATRPPDKQEREKNKLIDEWESEQGESQQYIEFEEWLAARKDSAVIDAAKKSSQEALKDQMSFRYVAGVFEGRGEDSDEFEGSAPIGHDADNLSWQVSYSIKDMGGMYAPPDTPVTLTKYTCSASDEMSIDAFASVCTAVWESMMLTGASPGVCMAR